VRLIKKFRLVKRLSLLPEWNFINFFKNCFSVCLNCNLSFMFEEMEVKFALSLEANFKTLLSGYAFFLRFLN